MNMVCTGGMANGTPVSEVCGADDTAPMSNWMSDGVTLGRTAARAGVADSGPASSSAVRPIASAPALLSAVRRLTDGDLSMGWVPPSNLGEQRRSTKNYPSRLGRVMTRTPRGSVRDQAQPVRGDQRLRAVVRTQLAEQPRLRVLHGLGGDTQRPCGLPYR